MYVDPVACIHLGRVESPLPSVHQLLHPMIDPAFQPEVLTTGLPASPRMELTPELGYIWGLAHRWLQGEGLSAWNHLPLTGQPMLTARGWALYQAMALAHLARGVDPAWVRSMYSFAIKPDAALFFRVPLEVAVGRILGARAELKYYEAGMDIGFSDNIVESFKIFQGKILDEYNKMVDEFGLTVIDGTQSVQAQQKIVRSIVKKVLKGWEGLPNPDKKDIGVQNLNITKHDAGKGKGDKK